MNTENMLDMDNEALQALYATTLYTLREARKTLLRQYGVEEEAELLEKIKNAEFAEHPTYEHYLSARIIGQTRMHVRAQAMEQLSGLKIDENGQPALHPLLQEKIQNHYAARLSEAVKITQDALLLSFDTGLVMEVRYASTDEYSIAWRWGEAELRLDTAPVHGVSPSLHLHDADTDVDMHPLAWAEEDGWLSLNRLIEVLLIDPLLENRRLSY